MSPSFIAIHSVIALHGDSSLDPVPPKQADATFIPIPSTENPRLLFSLFGLKSSFSDEPDANFCRSTSREGLSKDHESLKLISQSRITASSVRVTRQLPSTPYGCHRALTIGDCETTCVVGPIIFGFIRKGPLSGWPSKLDSGRRATWMVCKVTMAIYLPFGDIESCLICSLKLASST